MAEINVTEHKRPGRVTISQDEKLLVGRDEAAEMLSISRRALDYLVTNKQIAVRHIGARVLIQVRSETVFARGSPAEARWVTCCPAGHCCGRVTLVPTSQKSV
jgi:hypothetical protein